MTVSTDQFESLIRETTGFDKEYQWPISVEKGVTSMMSKMKIHDRSEFYQALNRSSNILFNFVQQFTINETYFNREPLLFELTSNILIPELLIEKQAKGPLHILSAGCSTGEEPYSLVIAMMERYGSGCKKLFTFSAVDIDIEAIMSAQEGRYSRRAVHMLDARVIDTYFHQLAPGQYRINNFIKNSVTFYQSPLKKISSVFPNHKMDIIFYRNVSIYFDPLTRQKIFHQLADLLNPKGFLLMSPTETFAHDFKRLALIEKEGVFVFHHQKQSVMSDSKPLQKNVNKKPDMSQKQKSDGLSHVIELANRKQYAYALEQLETYSCRDNDDVQACILKACILINLQQFNDARMICKHIFENDMLNEAACLLLGQMDHLENKKKNAQDYFNKALYINPQNWLAHYYLAKIYEEHQQIRLAVNTYQTVIKLLDEGKFNAHGLSFFPLSFSKSDIIFLCKTRLEKLKREASDVF
ncbi:MAG: hypothetical protein HQK75_13010 [Candidatus Magnetomorum sp.]|nr:hypothetical protein [Candidatus Magnetomorum sp.]